MFTIKCREKGRARYAFLSPKGTNYLRVHASQWQEREAAVRVLNILVDENPDWDFKIQEDKGGDHQNP
jgi:hypothetical protein